MKTKIFEEIEFFYLKFSYNKNVLIPRLDTESLVRKTIEVTKSHNIKTLIDVGLGSGIIAMSIEKNTSLEFVYGLEKSTRAITVAEINKTSLNSKIQIFKSDLLSYFFVNKNILKIKNQTVLLTANLPYVKDGDWVNMSEDTRFEPKMALFGGKKTGFELYMKFYKQLLEFKKIYSPKQIIVVVEMGFDQKEISEEFLKKKNIKSEFFADLCGIERFIISYI